MFYSTIFIPTLISHCAFSGKFQPGSLANGEMSSSSSGSEMESLKQEILAEMRKELQKIKEEIIEGSSF